MARKPRRLPGDILQKVVALREAHTSWIKIEQEVKIDRRTAKRAYEAWQRSKSVDELKEARKDIATEEFRNHMHCLITLAGSLSMLLSIPKTPNSKSLVIFNPDNMLQPNIFQGCSVYGVADIGSRPEARKLLLNSLKTHTGAIMRWDAFDEWKQVWDQCISALEKLQQETSNVIDNYIKMKQLSQKLKGGAKKKDIAERIVNGVLHTVWEQILKPSDDFPLIGIELRDGGRSDILFGKDKLVGGIVLDTELCQQLAEICNLGAKNVSLSEEAVGVTQLIKDMQKIIEEVRKSLNPLLLGPQILSTRCDLCPA